MAARLLSFLALVALLMMPFVPATAAGPAMPATSIPMAMTGEGHCGDAQKGPDDAVPGAHCGAACALLLPAACRRLQIFPAGRAEPAARAVRALESLTPQLGTPPPRFA